jgi:hypothetical protein
LACIIVVLVVAIGRLGGSRKRTADGRSGLYALYL